MPAIYRKKQKMQLIRRLPTLTICVIYKMSYRFNWAKQSKCFARAGIGSGAPAHARAGDLVAKDEAIMAQVGVITAGQRLSVAVPRNALTSFAVNPVDGNTQIVSAPLNRLTVRDLLQPGQTSASAVAYLRETGCTNNAAPVAENTTKPYSESTSS